MLKLYADGGVIQRNPSSIGGTWAWCLVNDDELIQSDSGVIIPTDVVTFPGNLVTNNQTELFAVIQGLSQLPDDAIVEVRSDSEVTLGRVFKMYAFNNIPFWMKSSLQIEKKRLKNFSKFTYELMDGHPTKAQVISGFGKRGHVTSKWNVLCDKMCNEAAERFLQSHVHIHQTISPSENF